MFDASVKWELTVWPLMDMANVAVSTLVAGPRIGGLELTSPTFLERHRFFPWIAGTVLRSIEPKLIIC